MLAAPDAIYPQFATPQRVHDRGDPRAGRRRATTSSSACTAWARASTTRSSGDGKLDRACRIYAPVGSHETLLAYLVRRLLENGANTSFVNRIVDPAVPHRRRWSPIRSRVARATGGAPHPRIPLPVALLPGPPQFAGRRPFRRRELAAPTLATRDWRTAAAPMRRRRAGADRCAASPRRTRRVATQRRPIRNPADRGDVVGTVVEATRGRCRAAPSAIAAEPAAAWSAAAGAPSAPRASSARPISSKRSAPTLCALAVREAGKTLANARRRSARGRRLLPLLRGAGARASCGRARRSRRSARSSRSRRGTFRWRSSSAQVERGARRRQSGAGQARRADAADRGRGGAPAASRRRAAGRAAAAARDAARPSARRWSPIRASPASSSPARPTSRALINRQLARARRRSGADRRDRRPERDDRRQLGAAGAGGRRRARLGVRQRRPALLGAARAVRAGRRRRPRCCAMLEGAMRELARRRPAPARDRRRPGDRRGGARRARSRTSQRMRARGPPRRRSCRCRADCATRHVRRADARRSRRRRRHSRS